mmetsp:Transcript_22460/g.51555  ORF Transcript_22460/g.51555 Transcript_22460/m.51555 type:complete len:373 (-) Transcript_22460:132-1250(-)
MMLQASPPPPAPVPPAPPLDVSPTRRTPPPRRGRRLSMERMVRRASIEGVSAALGLSRPTAPSAPPEPVKKVQFGGVEEKLFHFDWDLADDYFYTREQLRAMNNLRFEDASKLRAKMLKKESHSVAHDDSALTRRSAAGSTNQLLSDIINDRDEWDANISLDGIEPFVFLELKEEMVKKKAIVKKEIIDFLKANKSDPQGWRLASHSRFHTQWARGIAQDKARSLHEALVDESKNLTKKTELEKLKESQEILDGSIRAMRDRDSAPTPPRRTPPRRGVAGRRPQRRASICGPSSVSASAPNLSELFSVERAGTPTPPVEKVDRAQLQQLTKIFSLSESDGDDDDDGGGDGAPELTQLVSLVTLEGEEKKHDD